MTRPVRTDALSAISGNDLGVVGVGEGLHVDVFAAYLAVPQAAVPGHARSAVTGQTFSPAGQLRRDEVRCRQGMVTRAVGVSQAGVRSVADAILHVIGVCRPPQVANPVVGEVIIPVAALSSLGPWANEGFKYKLMDLAGAAPAIPSQIDQEAPVINAGLEDDSTSSLDDAVLADDGSIKAAYSAMAGHLVGAYIPGDGQPAFSCRSLSHVDPFRSVTPRVLTHAGAPQFYLNMGSP